MSTSSPSPSTLPGPPGVIRTDAGSTGSVLTSPALLTVESKLEAQAKAREQKREFAKKCTKDQIVYNQDKKQIISIAGLQFEKWTVEMLRTFLRSMDVKVGKLNVTKPVLQLQLLQWYNGTAVRDVMSSKKKKKGAKSTKPPAVTQDGTYYRVINTILHPEMKPTYMKTGDVLDRAALDAKIGHKGAWTVLHEFYKNEENFDLGLMAEPKFASTYASWNVKNDTPSKFDKLDIDEFTATVEFVNHHYKLAKRSNEQSGNHDDFQNYVEGKHWLLFYFAKLLELGDTDLDNLVSPALNDEVFLSSGTMQRSTKQNSKRFKMSAGDKKGMVTSQRAALELAVERSKLVTEVLENANKASQNDRLRELISLRFKASEQILKIGKPKDVQYSKKKKVMKRHLKIVEKEYQELKLKLNFCSDVSSSSCDDEESVSSDEEEDF